MNCLKCQMVNPDGAEFCMNCGQAMPRTVTCPRCGVESPPPANFCFNCGYRLDGGVGETPTAEAPLRAHAGVRQRIPQGLMDKLDAVRRQGDGVGERRVITMLFCDVSGSTALAGQFDPEVWADIMNEAFDYLIAPVYRYEGIVARLMGDGLLAFFGAPIAHEDDPQRAILAGLDIVRGMRNFRERIRQDYGAEFDVRVGINTGSVVVGEIGSDLAVEYTAMGDAINLASRMETTALPGTVQVSEDTYRLVSNLFDVWDLGPIPVKGKTEPVQAYRVLGWRSSPGHRESGDPLYVPLVGRERELERLNLAMEALRQGQGRIITLVGEAGLGKTRLIEELGEAWRGADFDGKRRLLWLESRGVSYEVNQPYGLFAAFIRQYMGIRENDPPPVVREKVIAGIPDLPDQQRLRMAQVVESIFGMGGAPQAPGKPAAGAPLLEGEDFNRTLFATLLEVTRVVATARPLVMVCEDLHWVDSASIELLAHLFQLVNEAPILFLCTYRPHPIEPAERFKARIEAAYAQQFFELRLQPLTEQESNRLVTGMLATDNLPAELRQIILQKTEGNPLFVEEVVRALIDNGVVTRDADGVRWDGAASMTLPDNVQSLLIARVDGLDRETRRTLQLAAVIGRTFPLLVLQRLVDTTVELDKHLDRLQRADLIRDVSPGPERVYAFRHALARDATYASILNRQRRAFHRRVGEALEAVYADRLEEEAHRLAAHFYEAQAYDGALTYTIMAGDHAARVYANSAAADLYGRAIEIATLDSPDKRTAGRNADLVAESAERRARLIHLYTRRGRVLEIAGRYDDALTNYAELERIGRARADSAMELASLIPRATLRATFTPKFDPQRGRVLSERALDLARGLKDHRAEARTLWNLMLLAVFGDDDRAQALVYGERSLALARAHHLRDELAYTLHDIANVYLEVGRKEEAHAAYEEAGALWRELGNQPMLVDNLANSAWHSYRSHCLDEALERVHEALRVSRSIDSLWGQAYSLMTLCPFHLAGNDYARAITDLEEAIPIAQQANFDVHAELRIALGGILGFLGDLERSLALIQGVHANSDKRKDQLLALVMLAQVYLHHGQLAEASAAFKEAERLFQAGTSNPTLSMYRLVAPVIAAEFACVAGAYDHVLSLTNEAMVHTDRLSVLGDLMRIKSQALMAFDRVEEAYETLEQAHIAAMTPDSDRMTWLILYTLWCRRTVWKALAQQSQAAARLGKGQEADRLLQEARSLVRSIAAGAAAVGLEHAFLALPDVQALLQSELAL